MASQVLTAHKKTVPNFQVEAMEDLDHAYIDS